MSYCFLTFDYELFLGRQTGSVRNCMIAPTEIILTHLKNRNAKATFFIDVLCYLRLRHENDVTRKEADLIKKQICNMVLDGHRVELHLHPHWQDATYDREYGWQFPTYEHYRLHSLPAEEINQLFQIGTQTLNDICREVKPDYNVASFRAGGWSIQPFDMLQPIFQKYNIKIDSSIGAGVKSDSYAQFFDFSAMNQNRSPYRFSSDPLVSDEQGLFYELPINTFPYGIIKKILGKMDRHSNKIMGDGLGISPRSNTEKTWFGKIANKIKNKRTFLTLDSLSANVALPLIKQQKISVVINHPKFLSDKSLHALDRLLNQDGIIFPAITEQNIKKVMEE